MKGSWWGVVFFRGERVRVGVIGEGFVGFCVFVF